MAVSGQAASAEAGFPEAVGGFSARRFLHTDFTTSLRFPAWESDMPRKRPACLSGAMIAEVTDGRPAVGRLGFQGFGPAVFTRPGNMGSRFA